MKKIFALSLTIAGCIGQQSDLDQVQSQADVIAQSHACDTPQIYGNGAHTGAKACAPLPALHVQGVVAVDPAAPLEAPDGNLFVHYSTPISNGAFMYTGVKRGFTDRSHVGTQTWSVQASKWIGHALVPAWKTDSKWSPYTALNPVGNTNGDEEEFQPALVTTGAFAGILMPSSSGQLVRLDPATGAQLGVINPLAGTSFDGDALAIVSSGISVRDDGTVAYTVIAYLPKGPLNKAPRGSWLVLARPNGTVTTTAISAIATRASGVKQPGDQCIVPFTLSPVPVHAFPPSPDAAPITIACGGVEPVINATPAFGNHGDVVIFVGDASNSIWTSYVMDVDTTTLAANWATQLHDYSQDGCGVNIPFDSGGGAFCPTGSHLGVDPFFNVFPLGDRSDILTTSPVVAPDGNVFIGAFSNNGLLDNFDGRVVELDGAGHILASKRGGFNITPAIRRTGTGVHDYELVADDDRFDDIVGAGEGPDLIARVGRFSPNGLTAISTFTSPNDPDKFANDYLDEQPVFDTAGNSYHLNAAGRLDEVSATGQLIASVDLGFSIEPLEQTLSWGTDGFGQPVIYVPYGGFVYAIGTTPMQGPLPTFPISAAANLRSTASSSHRRGMTALGL